MAYKKISELTNLSNPNLTGVTVVVDGNTTYKTSLNTLKHVLVENGSHSFTGSQTILGNLTISGSITAQQYTISSSLVNYEIQNISGSTNFGDTLNDSHNFTGSVNITGSLIINGTSFTSASSGTSGIDGSSGTSGIDGSSGTSGESGSSGTSGTSPIVDTSIFATTGSNDFYGDQNIYNGNVYYSNNVNEADFYINLENIEPYVILSNYSSSGHASFYVEGPTASLQISAGHDGSKIKSFTNIANDYVDVIRFSDYDDDGSLDMYTDVRMSGSLSLHNTILNTGLTNYIVIDNVTGKLYYTNIGGSGSSGTSGQSGSSGTSGTSSPIDTSTFATTGSNNFTGDQNIYTGSLFMSSDNGSEFYANLSNITPYVILSNYEPTGDVTMYVESISGSVSLYANDTGCYIQDYVNSLNGYNPVIKFSTYDGDGSVDLMRDIRITGSLDIQNNLMVNNYTILSKVSSSLNFANDTAAALGGVPLGGLYRSGSVVLIRVT